ncbi:MAG: MFS transporter [Thermoprotei archaeon]
MVENETALDKARSLRWLVFSSVIVAFSFFLSGFDNNLYFFGSAYIFKNIGASSLLLGITATGFAAGIAIFSMVGGWIFDRVTTRNGIVISVLIISIFTALTGLARNWPDLLIFRFMVGFGVGMLQPEVLAFLGGLRPRYRATVMATSGIFFNLGLALGPPAFSALSSGESFDVPFLVAGALGFVLSALLVMFVPSTYKRPERPKAGLLKNISLPLVLAAVSYFFFGVAFFAFESYYSSYLTAIGIPEKMAALAFAAFGMAGLIMGYPSAFAGDKVSRRGSIIAGALLASSGAAIAFGLSHSFVVAALGAGIIGTGYSLYSNVVAYAQEVVEDSWRGSAVGLLFAVYNFGTMAGGPLMSSALSSFGYRTAGLFVISVPFLISLLVFLPAAMAKVASK